MIWLIMAAIGYLILPASCGVSGAASPNFTLWLLGGTATGTEQFTPGDNGGGGSFSASPITLSAGQTNKTFTYTPATVGNFKLGFTNNQGWTDQIGYVQNTFDGSTVTATTGGVSNTITLSGLTLASPSDYAGRTVLVTGGTNFVAGGYTITSATGTTITLDRNCTTGAGAAMAGQIAAVGAGVHTFYSQEFSPPTRTGTYQFSNPSGLTKLYTGQRSNVFYSDETVTFRVFKSSAATKYRIRNYSGSVIDSGTFDASGGDVVITPSNVSGTCGFYTVEFYQNTVDGTFGQSVGSWFLGVISRSSNLYARPPYWSFYGDFPNSGGTTAQKPMNADQPPSNAPFYAVYQGYVQPTSTGSYTFTFGLTAGVCKVKINGVVYYDNLVSGANFTTASIPLTGGQKYPVLIERSDAGTGQFFIQYDNGGGATNLPSAWQYDATGTTSGGVTVTYYSPLISSQQSDTDGVVHAMCGLGPFRLEINNACQPAAEVNNLAPLITFWQTNQKGKDSARPNDLLFYFTYYRVKRTLSAQAASGQPVLNLNGPGAMSMFAAGNTIVIGNETKTVQSVNASTVTLTTNLISTWPAGTNVFNDTATEDAAITSVASTYAGIVTHFAAINEPDQSPAGPMSGSAAAGYFASFRTTVLAGNASAKIVGPNAVGILPGTLSGFLKAFFDAGGGASIDCFGYHDYNTFNGELAGFRDTMDGAKTFLAGYGLSALLWWQTEQGYYAQLYGSYQPHLQARWSMLAKLVREMYGIPKEQDYYWYEGQHGFNNFPTQLVNDDLQKSWNPAALLFRVWSDNLWGVSFASRYNFGSGDDTHLGALFTGSGKSVAMFMGAGNPDTSITLSVSGGNGQLNCQDAWGNPVTLSASGGTATISGGLELPFYVILQSGQSVSPSNTSWGTNYGPTTTVTTSGNVQNLSAINNNVIEAVYYNGLPAYRDQYPNPSTFPVTLDFDLFLARRIARINLHCPSTWQTGTSLLEYDLYYWDGSQWSYPPGVSHVSRNPTDVGVFGGNVFSTATSYYDQKHVFEHVFDSVITAKKFRLVVQRATWGGSSSQLIAEAGGQGLLLPLLSLSEFRAWGTAIPSGPTPPSQIWLG